MMRVRIAWGLSDLVLLGVRLLTPWHGSSHSGGVCARVAHAWRRLLRAWPGEAVFATLVFYQLASS